MARRWEGLDALGTVQGRLGLSNPSHTRFGKDGRQEGTLGASCEKFVLAGNGGGRKCAVKWEVGFGRLNLGPRFRI